MTCSNCNPTCGNDPCGECNGCKPARYSCGDVSIVPNPFDESIWMVTIQGCTTKVKIPKINETDTKLSTNYTSSSLIYNAERHTDILTGSQLGQLINVEDLRDTDTSNADSCDLLVYNPYCSDCGDGCKPKNARWTNYHIPDAGDCVMEVDDDGYYKVLTKNECGCIEECRLPVVPSGMTSINYVRDSVPDDPDFPWYYGIYNDTINLHLEQNAPNYFGKYALKITVNYTIQVILSDQCTNVNFRSLLCPVYDGQSIVNIEEQSSILQGFSGFSPSSPEIPWGSQSMRGSFVFIVPKGKEAYLHHEFRLHSVASFSEPDHYMRNATYDGKRVPDDIASQVNALPYNASRLNALQVIVEPTFGSANFDPVVDPERAELDPAIDLYDDQS